MTKLYISEIILYIGSNADIGCISATNRFLYLSAIKCWSNFFFNLLNEVTHRQNKGSVEKNVSLKVTLNIKKWFLHLEGHIEHFDYTVLT